MDGPKLKTNGGKHKLKNHLEEQIQEMWEEIIGTILKSCPPNTTDIEDHLSEKQMNALCRNVDGITKLICQMDERKTKWHKVDEILLTTVASQTEKLLNGVSVDDLIEAHGQNDLGKYFTKPAWEKLRSMVVDTLGEMKNE